MAYRVEYDDRKQEKKKGRGFRLIPMTAAAWLGFVLLVQTYWPEGQAVLRQFLIPDSAAAALEAFAMELRSGELFPDALESFCREVMEGGEADLH